MSKENVLFIISNKLIIIIENKFISTNFSNIINTKYIKKKQKKMSTSKAQQVTSTTVKEVTAGLAELDFNVSDEEISQAKQYWQESSQSNYLELNFVQHPV